MPEVQDKLDSLGPKSLSKAVISRSIFFCRLPPFFEPHAVAEDGADEGREGVCAAGADAQDVLLGADVLEGKHLERAQLDDRAGRGVDCEPRRRAAGLPR